MSAPHQNVDDAKMGRDSSIIRVISG